MPIYCYETEEGEIIERLYDSDKAPDRIVVNGVRARRSYQAEGVSVPATSGWPIECYASGVHPSQRKELKDHLASKGVPTDVTPDGDPIYTSHAHRKKALKARGLIDRSGYE